MKLVWTYDWIHQNDDFTSKLKNTTITKCWCWNLIIQGCRLRRKNPFNPSIEYGDNLTHGRYKMIILLLAVKYHNSQSVDDENLESNICRLEWHDPFNSFMEYDHYPTRQDSKFNLLLVTIYRNNQIYIMKTENSKVLTGCSG